MARPGQFGPVGSGAHAHTEPFFVSLATDRRPVDRLPHEPLIPSVGRNRRRSPLRASAGAALIGCACLLLVGCRQELPPLAAVVQAEAAATPLHSPTTSTSAEPGSGNSRGTGSSSGSGSSSGADSSSGAGTTTAPTTSAAPAQDELTQIRERVARVLAQQLQGRRLTVADHGAWQVLHGVVAYGASFPLTVDATGQTQPAIPYLLQGGQLKGWNFAPGDMHPESQRRGLRAIVEPGTKTGQGHYDQWLAILARCELPPETELRVQGQTFLLSDLIWQVQQDVPRNPLREYSWTLGALSYYAGTQSEWTAGDGHRWSVTRLLQEELQQEVNGSACGGTHRLMGIAVALNNHRRQGGVVVGPWLVAQDHLRQYIQLTQRLQNSDGSFSTRFFVRPSASTDVTGNLAATGHILEFLTIGLSPAELQEPWVVQAANHLCNLLESTTTLDLECGSLYHALHGLLLFQQRTGDASAAVAGAAAASG